MGEWETVKFATRFTSIRLIKQENFLGPTEITYFVENCLEFTLTVFNSPSPVIDPVKIFECRENSFFRYYMAQ